MRRQVALVGAAALSLAVAEAGRAQDLSPPEHVAALKISLAASQAVVRQHEWIETTIVRLKGEEKARRREQEGGADRLHEGGGGRW